jgi:hypothetical protein
MRPPEAPEDSLVEKQFLQQRGIEPQAPAPEAPGQGIIPESPLERQQRQLEEQERRRQMVSDPGKATGPSPANPMQQLQVYTKNHKTFNVGDNLVLKSDVMGEVDEGYSKFVNIPAGSRVLVVSKDADTGYVQVTHDKVTAFVEPNDVQADESIEPIWEEVSE